MEHVVNCDKLDCCGCTACAQICEQDAIRMEADAEGFLYPLRDEEKCVFCGRCSAVCPVLSAVATCDEPKARYAAKYRDEAIRMQSASGAAYTALSDYVLEHEGIVYGVVFDADWSVAYTRITDKAGRDRSRGSKYVQSRLGDTFRQVKADLDDGRLVLFVGPACYVAGLKQYSSLSCENSAGSLLTVDMVCHGAPSPRVWKDHVAFLNEQYPGEWKAYNFRDKTIDWHVVHSTLTLEDGKVSDTRALNAYTGLYFGEYISRPACHRCRYTNLKRPGDLTIGDCWGVQETHPDFVDENGVSLVMVNTAAGADLFEHVRQQFDLILLAEGECIQPQLRAPATPAEARGEFWEMYEEKGYEACLKKYTNYGNARRLRQRLKRR